MSHKLLPFVHCFQVLPLSPFLWLEGLNPLGSYCWSLARFTRFPKVSWLLFSPSLASSFSHSVSSRSKPRNDLGAVSSWHFFSYTVFQISNLNRHSWIMQSNLCGQIICGLPIFLINSWNCFFIEWIKTVFIDLLWTFVSDKRIWEKGPKQILMISN